MQGAQVQSLVGELRSHMLHSAAKEQNFFKTEDLYLLIFVPSAPCISATWPSLTR